MHHNIYYKGTREEIRMKGFADVSDYLGERGFSKLLKAVHGIIWDNTLTKRQKINWIRMACCFAGVQGVPVVSLRRTLIQCPPAKPRPIEGEGIF